MTGYQRFLGASSRVVLPYFGGPFVELEDRRVRVAAPIAPGYWHFEVTGRSARALEPAEPPDLSHLAAVRGHYVAGYLVHSRAELLALPCEEEPPRFAPLVARRWPTGGALLPERVDFEGEAEELVRQAFEDRRPLNEVKGVPASLRAAYGYAVLRRAGEELGVAVRPGEARHRAGGIADGGDPAARRVLREVAAERAHREVASVAAETARRAGPNQWASTSRSYDRAAAALHAAGASLLEARNLPDDLIEVRFRFDGERFAAVAQAATLQVVDAGICLEGSDRELTLESLPSVIREAMGSGELYITRHA
ncbi:hypothetical protein F4561_002558 [Lipingzhangella halophila]|uniref:Uncharacterized protein n=1 Tax=Lipingzhangella halophila TaxID=1783352 RepID=A0A7W7W2S4_9ACTN|nr:hypothetical protein [Lipingzhangella halophila]MBB4931738.1 hypothetical protein [Lipingzhangella halophila]